jgi:tripartite-type tricarboxylate transporter receptor subunit TctC
MSGRWIACALALAGWACGGTEGPYPSREIKLVVQASPGGTSDTVSRVMASLAEGELGVPIVCENKPGAAGALAFSYVARRPADGYTIGHAPVEIAMVRSLGYADVGPGQMSLICMVSKTPPALVVRAESEWQTFEDFVRAAKSRPGELIMANSGVGSIWHFNTLLLERETGIRVTHLPYPGSSGALVALLGGHVDAVVAGVGEVVAHVESGKLRPLAVFDESRTGVFPDTPTTHELGFAIGAPAWSGFFGPAGMPEEAVDKLAGAFGDAFRTEQWETLCRERGMTPAFLGRGEFEQFAFEQAELFGRQIPELLRMQR